MDSPAATTFVFAPEIEQALVAACFVVPERIALVYRELDPALHITQPHLRHILDAIRLAYSELGSTDFPSVIQVLREEGNLEECGGLDGVNNVLDQYRFGFSSPEAAEEIIAHYLEMLKTYAANREKDLLQPVYRFSGGKGTVFQNKVKRREFDPDFVGIVRIRGHSLSARAWIARDGSFINFTLQPEP